MQIEYEKKTESRSNFLRPENKEIKKRVYHLANRLRISKQQLCGITELVRIEEYLEDYQIIVIDSNYSITESPVYLNKGKRFEKFLYLAYEQNHYFPITSMTAYLNKRYFCNPCKLGYSNPEDHVCENVCKSCFRLDCEKQFSFPCQCCHVLHRNLTCIKIHNETYCKSVRLCADCNNYKQRVHVCGDDKKWCGNCKDSVDREHKCFIKKLEPQLINEKFEGFIFFDFEA